MKTIFLSSSIANQNERDLILLQPEMPWDEKPIKLQKRGNRPTINDIASSCLHEAHFHFKKCITWRNIERCPNQIEKAKT
jgi:hypothetical protein